MVPYDTMMVAPSPDLLVRWRTKWPRSSKTSTAWSATTFLGALGDGPWPWVVGIHQGPGRWPVTGPRVGFTRAWEVWRFAELEVDRHPVTGWSWAWLKVKSWTKFDFLNIFFSIIHRDQALTKTLSISSFAMIKPLLNHPFRHRLATHQSQVHHQFTFTSN